MSSILMTHDHDRTDMTPFTFPGHPEKPEVDPEVRTVPGRNLAWKISWATKSYANVTEYRLLYRKIPVSGDPMVKLNRG